MFRRLASVALAIVLAFSASASAQLLSTSYFDGAIKQYNLDGSGLQGFANGPGQNGVVGPSGITVAANNDVYFSAQGSNGGSAADNAIFKYSPVTGLVTTFITPAQLSAITNNAVYGPTALRFGPDGNLYVARGGTTGNVFTGAIDRFTAAGVFDATIATGLTNPTGMLIQGNTLYVSNLGGPNMDFYGDVVKVNNFTGGAPTVTPFITTNSGGLENPTGLAIGPDGKFYVADVSFVGNSAVRRYNADGTFTGANSLLIAQPFGFTSDILFTGGKMIIGNLGNPNFGIPGGIFAYNDTTFAFDSQLAAGTGFGNLALVTGVVPEPAGLLAVACVGGVLYRRRKC